jgi:hypothetical protein
MICITRQIVHGFIYGFNLKCSGFTPKMAQAVCNYIATQILQFLYIGAQALDFVG